MAGTRKQGTRGSTERQGSSSGNLAGFLAGDSAESSWKARKNVIGKRWAKRYERIFIFSVNARRKSCAAPVCRKIWGWGGVPGKRLHTGVLCHVIRSCLEELFFVSVERYEFRTTLVERRK